MTSKKTLVHPKQIRDIDSERDLHSRIEQIEFMESPVELYSQLPTVGLIDGSVCLVKQEHTFYQYILAEKRWEPISPPIDIYESVRYENTVVIEEPTKEVPLGIPEFNPLLDTIEVYHRGVRIDNVYWGLREDSEEEIVDFTYTLKRIPDRVVFIVEGRRLKGGDAS